MSIENDLKTQQEEGLSNLLKPFAPNEINSIPKGGISLDYVGHAALTKRLLQTDLAWTWEPVALDELGLPCFDKNGGLWIRLTVCGVTRLGYGDAGGKSGGNAIKEAIGDALRNAGMRFGAALDLWHKGDLWEAQESAKNDGKVIGKDSSKVANFSKPEPTKEYSDDVLFAASSALDFVEVVETEAELKTWYNSPAIQKILDVPVDLAGTTIRSATKARVAKFTKEATNV